MLNEPGVSSSLQSAHRFDPTIIERKIGNWPEHQQLILTVKVPSVTTAPSPTVPCRNCCTAHTSTRNFPRSWCVASPPCILSKTCRCHTDDEPNAGNDHIQEHALGSHYLVTHSASWQLADVRHRESWSPTKLHWHRHLRYTFTNLPIPTYRTRLQQND